MFRKKPSKLCELENELYERELEPILAACREAEENLTEVLRSFEPNSERRWIIVNDLEDLKRLLPEDLKEGLKKRAIEQHLKTLQEWKESKKKNG